MSGSPSVALVDGTRTSMQRDALGRLDAAIDNGAHDNGENSNNGHGSEPAEHEAEDEAEVVVTAGRAFGVVGVAVGHALAVDKHGKVGQVVLQ